MSKKENIFEPEIFLEDYNFMTFLTGCIGLGISAFTFISSGIALIGWMIS